MEKRLHITVSVVKRHTPEQYNVEKHHRQWEIASNRYV
jgi:hypothetical protein